MFNLESLSNEAYFALGKIDAILTLICFIVLLYLIWLNRSLLWRHFRTIGKRVWLILFLLLLFSIFLRTAVVVPKNLIYIDEHMYMHRADQMFTDNLHLPYDDIDIIWYSKSNGWPFIQSIFFRLFSPGNMLPIYISIVLGSLTCVVLFFILNLLTNNKRISLITSLIYTLFSLNIFWSTSADNTTPSVFFISMTIFFILLYYENRSRLLLWLSIISLAFMTHFRIENYAIAIIFFFSYLYSKRRIIFSTISSFIKTLLPMVAYVVLVFPDALFMLAFSSTSCSDIEPQKLASFIHSFSSNYLHMILFILLFVLMLLGLGYLVKSKLNQAVLILSLYISAVSIVIFFWLNSLFSYFPFSLEYFNLYNRFLLTAIFATCVFVGYGLNYLSILRKSNYSLLVVLPSIAIALILSLTIISDVGEMNNGALVLQSKIPGFISANLSDDVLVVSSCPEIFIDYDHVIDYKQYISLRGLSSLPETYFVKDFCYYSREHAGVIEDINSSTILSTYHMFEWKGFIFEILTAG